MRKWIVWLALNAAVMAAAFDQAGRHRASGPAHSLLVAVGVAAAAALLGSVVGGLVVAISGDERLGDMECRMAVLEERVPE